MKFLHVGCGPKRKDQTTPVFQKDNWEEITLDINPKCNPDIISSITDMSMIEDSTFDAIYSSHNIEHLYMHDAVKAVNEFKRVLKDTGYVLLICPDLESVCKAVIEKGALTPLYYTDKEKKLYVSPIDILYGWRAAIQNGDYYMAHKSGFTDKILIELFKQAGFKKASLKTRPNFYDIHIAAFKGEGLSNDYVENILNQHIIS